MNVHQFREEEMTTRTLFPKLLPAALLCALCMAIPLIAAEPIATEFKQAIHPRVFSFPQDHGRHDGFRTEWWYFTGNVADESGREFGYQLTFFRTSLVPDRVQGPSPWRMRDLYFGHAAVSDVANQKFYFKDRLSREHAGLAQSSDHTLDVKLLDWTAVLESQSISIKAIEPIFAIDLICEPGRGPVLQGPGGVNAKGHERDQASYYYTMTRLPTHGTLTVAGKKFTVRGMSWMDHEFSSNALGPKQVGWDWMGLSLKDGDDLMIYRMRNKEGGNDYLSGTLITPDGSPRYLAANEITLEPGEIWKSGATDAAYPQRWALTVAGLPPMVVKAKFPGQELVTESSTKVNYFEGTSIVIDQQGRRMGDGYLEMTGYGKSLGGF